MTLSISNANEQTNDFGLDLISVVVPVYNAADTICECLNSICRQTYSNLEIIVVYLESTDHTLDKIKSIKDKRIRLVSQEQKTGPGGARNIGLDNAKGQWIGFVEADDTISPDFYEKLIIEAQKNNADIAVGEITINGKVWTRHKKNALFSTVTEKLNLIQNGACFDKLFKTKLISDHRIKHTEYIRFEDNPFIFEAYYEAGRIVTVKDAVYYYNPSVWNETYYAALEKSIVPAAQAVLEIMNTKNLTPGETLLVQKKIMKSFASSFIENEKIYADLRKLMDDPFFLRVLFFKRKFKKLKKKILGKRKEKSS